ncbi:MAG: NUDIX domain-containing protein [Paramuribaculum sp.]|nr:NUDIX domain-containing protein [Paramuribaculum sp.]MDE7470780.1 NUDIX domain-containing protein [Paramuribaculum sp.]
MAEIFPIVDTEGRTIGSATRAVCHDGKSHLLHPVVHLHVISRDGSRVLLQRRSMSKDIQPGRWDTTVGGHVDYGESVAEALAREAREELGLDTTGAELLERYVWESDRERELVNVHLQWKDEDEISLTVDPVEIDEARYWSLVEIREAWGKGILTPNFEKEFFERILPKIGRS